jgi:hypothetical protein
VCCIVALMALIGPRVAFVFTWLFTDQVDLAFDGDFWVPLLGLVLLPWTALMYALCYSPTEGISGFGIFLVAFGVLADFASYAGGRFSRR